MDLSLANAFLTEIIDQNKDVNILDPNFPKQTEFIQDEAKRKTLWCTRRAAKSYTGGLYLAETAIRYRGVNCLYLGLTRLSAKGIIWKDILKTINEKNSLGFQFNGTELTATSPNGSIIYVTGVDDTEEEMQKLLGKKWKLVILDESQSYSINLRNLIYGVLGPAVIDQGGTICMLGTAGNITQGLFYDVTNRKEPGWKLFQWTAHDNPYVAKQWQEELNKIDVERPLFKETPLYKQWYLNQWVVDEEKLVYKFNIDRNLFREWPKQLNPNGWTYVLGVDTGWEDDNAFVLVAFHENDPALYVCKTFNKPKMTFDAVVLKIQEFMNDKDMPPAKVIIDGANKQGVESMRHRSSIPFEYADKTGKVDFIEMLNADLIQAKIKIHSNCTNLIQEMMGLVWKTDGDSIVFPKKEHPALPNHLCDAFLYSWRNGFHYHSQPEKTIIHVGSKLWYDQQATDIWEKERERMIQQNEWPQEDIGWSKS